MATKQKEMIDGAAAIARGALDAGCNFFAGYPITPASGILAHMLRELPKVGGIGIQGEDEISSIGHCIGAATAGATAGAAGTTTGAAGTAAGAAAGATTTAHRVRTLSASRAKVAARAQKRTLLLLPLLRVRGLGFRGFIRAQGGRRSRSTWGGGAGAGARASPCDGAFRVSRRVLAAALQKLVRQGVPWWPRPGLWRVLGYPRGRSCL